MWAWGHRTVAWRVHANCDGGAVACLSGSDRGSLVYLYCVLTVRRNRGPD